MYTVFIADDEPWVVIGLQNLIPWEALGFQIIGTAQDGIDTFEQVKALTPDLLLSDIRMPGMDGVALLRAIHREQLPTRVVLISGYADFQYAQSAIRYGAVDYLIKQVEREDLLAVVKRVKLSLEARAQAKQRADAFLEDLTDMLWPEKAASVAEWMRRKGLREDWPSYVFIKMRVSGQVREVDGPFISADFELDLLHTGQSAYAGILGFEGPLQRALRGLPLPLSPSENGAAHAGISGISDREGSIFHMSEEADIALYSEQLFPLTGCRQYRPMTEAEWLCLDIHGLTQCIAARNTEKIQGHIRRLRGECAAGRIQLDALLDIHAQIERAFRQHEVNAQKQTERIRNFRQFAEGFAQGEGYFDMLEDLFDEAQGGAYSGENQLIRAVMEAIESEYTTSISVQSISKRHNISQGYLSNLIKRETGLTFTEHILERRMKKANELLLSTDKTISEISELVGYSDYFYFSRLYRKKHGMPPGSYRKMAGRKG